MYTVEVKVGVLTENVTVHTWLEITHPDGHTESWGFYPAEAGNLNGDGRVKSDDDSVSNAGSGPIPLTESQFNALNDYITSTRETPPPYALPFGAQCTNWALQGLAAAEVIPSYLGSEMGADNIMEAMLKTIFFNPLLQKWGFDLNDLFEDVLKIGEGLLDAFGKFVNAVSRDPSAYEYYNLPNAYEGLNPTNPDATPVGDSDTTSENFSSPLVLDLNNNQRTSTPLLMSDTYFDLDGDGFAERTGWIEAEDGLLALDKNQNGNIDNGNELFGNYSQNDDGHLAENGFSALTDYDINNDGIINAADDVFESLQVWTDTNSDGISQDGELHSLSDLHIESISLNATEVNTEEKWNQISHESTFTQQAVDDDGNVVTDQDGNAVLEEKAVRDVWFASDRQDTTYQYEGEISAVIAALPEMKGMGRIMNLSHSMAEDATLQQQVETLLTSASSDLATI